MLPQIDQSNNLEPQVPLETGTYISDLVPSNPSASDGMNNADDHMRLIKGALQSTFPAVAGAVTASHTQLNSILGQFTGTVSYTALLGSAAAPAYGFTGDLDTGWYSPAANRAALSLGGADALNFAADKTANFAAGASFAAAVSASNFAGAGTIPIGGMIMWLTDVLPVGNGVWCWANGGTLSRTAVGGGKELFDLWGTYYGLGDGSTTFNVIDMQEIVPLGKSTMGGGAAPGWLSTIISGWKTVLGVGFGNQSSVLTTDNLPPYTPAGAITNGAITINGQNLLRNVAGDSNNNGGGGGSFGAMSATAPTLTATQGGSTFTGFPQGGSSQPVANIQPSRVVNFIIRIA